jgi:hypothetical protein
MDWKTEGSEIDFWSDEEYSLFLVFHTVSGAHPGSYPLGTGDNFLWYKAAWT